jgi:hypothetical protein
VTENNPAESAPPEVEQPVPEAEEPLAAGPGQEDPGYLTETGEAAGDDGTVVPIIGGLPAVEGSAWDIGAPADERGTALVHDQPDQERPGGREDDR